MKQRPREAIGTMTAGPRLRCFLGLILPAILCVPSLQAFAQGNCVAPRGIAVAQIRGQVFDAFGIAVPFATITVLGIHGAVQTTADDAGNFSFNMPSGHYVLKAEAEGFSYSSAEVKVGQSLNTLFTRPKLKVMLGFNGSYCSWVTTSKTDFQNTAAANMKRLKESAQIKDADPSDETSQTKENSQTHATQK